MVRSRFIVVEVPERQEEALNDLLASAFVSAVVGAGSTKVSEVQKQKRVIHCELECGKFYRGRNCNTH